MDFTSLPILEGRLSLYGEFFLRNASEIPNHYANTDAINSHHLHLAPSSFFQKACFLPLLLVCTNHLHSQIDLLAASRNSWAFAIRPTLPIHFDREQIIGRYTMPAILVIDRISMSIPADNFAKLALLPSAV